MLSKHERAKTGRVTIKMRGLRWTVLCFNREAILPLIISIVDWKLTTQEMCNDFCNVHTLQ